MTFAEELPDQCPPQEAVDQKLERVCRFLTFEQSDPKNFYSHSKLGKPSGKASECHARSLSLFKEDAVPNFVAAKRMAFFRKCKIAILTIPCGVGLSVVGKTGHIDLWPFQGSDVSACSTEVLETPDEIQKNISGGPRHV